MLSSSECILRWSDQTLAQITKFRHYDLHTTSDIWEIEMVQRSTAFRDRVVTKNYQINCLSGQFRRRIDVDISTRFIERRKRVEKLTSIQRRIVENRLCLLDLIMFRVMATKAIGIYKFSKYSGKILVDSRDLQT